MNRVLLLIIMVFIEYFYNSKSRAMIVWPENRSSSIETVTLLIADLFCQLHFRLPGNKWFDILDLLQNKTHHNIDARWSSPRLVLSNGNTPDRLVRKSKGGAPTPWEESLLIIGFTYHIVIIKKSASINLKSLLCRAHEHFIDC
jgi:hypothetical protein